MERQYLDLASKILEKGLSKGSGRDNMPETLSLFGEQISCNLQDGFPLLTTKSIDFYKIKTELAWFLRGDTNIKFLVDRGCNIWNEDAYNYYKKQCDIEGTKHKATFESFLEIIKNSTREELDEIFVSNRGVTLGSCGFQYGRVWRRYKKIEYDIEQRRYIRYIDIDQILDLIIGLRSNPESRRHIVTSIDPTHQDNLALYWCHSMFQMYCEPLTWEEKINWAKRNPEVEMENLAITEAATGPDCPKYKLSCHMYQRSADLFLGVPFNIASYALLTHFLCQMTGYLPGRLIISFGDVHIYKNHIEQIQKQLSRTPRPLPMLQTQRDYTIRYDTPEKIVDFLDNIEPEDFLDIMFYNPHPSIKGKLSTGLR